jgi:hypothetical protein
MAPYPRPVAGPGPSAVALPALRRTVASVRLPTGLTVTITGDQV